MRFQATSFHEVAASLRLARAEYEKESINSDTYSALLSTLLLTVAPRWLGHIFAAPDSVEDFFYFFLAPHAPAADLLALLSTALQLVRFVLSSILSFVYL